MLYVPQAWWRSMWFLGWEGIRWRGQRGKGRGLSFKETQKSSSSGKMRVCCRKDLRPTLFLDFPPFPTQRRLVHTNHLQTAWASLLVCSRDPTPKMLQDPVVGENLRTIDRTKARQAASHELRRNRIFNVRRLRLQKTQVG